MSGLATSLEPPSQSVDSPAEAVRALHAARRRARLEQLDWLDALYHAYVAAIVGIVVVLFLSSLVGGEHVSAETLDDVRADGPGWLGLVAAAALAAGVRSGSRGGPLALEAADVRHVLLAPVPRALALRGPAVRQVRFALFAGAVTGAVAGQLAVRRLGGAPLAWVATGAIFGALGAAVFFGTGLLASGHRVPRPVATGVGAVALAWAALDATGAVWAPFRWFGELALWPLHTPWTGALAVLLGVAAVAGGAWSMDGLSLESAERRTALVGQLRFAATMRDLRTVIVLRRQLAQERPRSRPWIARRGRPRLGTGWHRAWQGLLRFPAPRLLRLVLLAIGAGLAARAVWEGTTPLIVAVGGCLYVAALDAVEPLAQQADQHDHTSGLPVERGALFVRLLAPSALLMLALTALGAAIAVASDPSAGALAIAALIAVPAAGTATAGAVAAVLMEPPQPFSEGQALPPEVAGMAMTMRMAWPVVLSVIGVLPLLAARAAAEDGTDPVAATAVTALLALVPVALSPVWVRYRDAAHAWWRGVLEQGAAARRTA